MIKDIKYTEAISCQGDLKKQRPGFVKVFQKRFFTIRDKGRFLVWFETRPTKADQNPNGAITIASIIKVSASEKQKQTRIFQITYPERTFILKAVLILQCKKSQEERDKWIDSLNYIMEFRKKYAKEFEDNRDSTGSSEKKKSWRWQSIDQEVIHRIQLEHQEMMMDEVDQQDELTTVERNKQIMANKKLVVHLDNEEMMDRIICGFLHKKGKLNNLTSFKQRWFFMVSDCNLKNLTDKKRLVLNQFPDWVKINTIYYFSPKEDDQEFRGNIKLESLQDVHMDLSDSPYKLILKTEEREYIFGNKYLSEIKKWDDAIKMVLQRWKVERQYMQNRVRTFKGEQNVLHECEVKYNGKKKYLIVKENWLALLETKDNYGLQSILVEYSTISTSQMNKKELKISTDIMMKLVFDDEGDCQNVQGILLDAQKRDIELKKKESEQMQTSINKNKKSPEKDSGKKEEEDNRNTYLGRKVMDNQTKPSKNFYKLYAMNMEDNEPDQSQQMEVIVPKSKVEEPKGFFHRLSMMFCGGSSD